MQAAPPFRPILSSVPNSGNAAEMLLATSWERPDATALIEDGRTVDYGGLAARAGAFAQAIQDAGVLPGERVAVLLRRGVEAAAAFFGILATGAAAVTINEGLRARQIDYILRHSGATALVSSGELLRQLPRSLTSAARLIDVAAVPLAADVMPVRRVALDLAHIIYTSGSTGMPKGVAISHGNLWAGVDAVVSYLSITEADRIASLLPFSFDYGLNQLLCCARTGATLVVERSPVPQRILDTLARHEVSVLPAVPPLWLQLLSTRAFEVRLLPALRVMTNTGGRLPTDAVRKLRASQPQADLMLMYGLTEAFRSTYLRPEAADAKPGSIGQAIPGAEILVLDESLRPCPAGTVGQLVHRGPTVALGYWKDPDATAARFRPHPLRPPGMPDAERVVFSGDLVYRDEDGDLFFVGRDDTMIKTLGYRVSPDEVADVLYASGEVLEALVASEPDEARGALVIAYVVLCDGGDREQLAAFCARELPTYMRPSRIEVLDALPRTASGKHDPTAIRS